jgi:hypothetical protein
MSNEPLTHDKIAKYIARAHQAVETGKLGWRMKII